MYHVRRAAFVCHIWSIHLFDVTQQGNSSHGPVSWASVTFKVNGPNVVQISSGWLSVYWTFIQPKTQHGGI